MAQVVLTVGTSGLAKGDLGLRFYRNGSSVPSAVTAMSVSELGATGDYRVTGMPEIDAGTWGTLTWEYPEGAGGFYVYPTPQDGTPPNLVIPVREAGLILSDFDFRLYLDGVTRGDTLTVSEVGSPGDYKVSGWPTNVAGEWVLVWTRHGITFNYDWTAAATVTPVTATEVSSSFLAEFADLMADTITAQPVTLDAFGDETNAGDALTIPCHIEGEAKLIMGSDGQETVSRVQAYLGQIYNLDVDSYRFTLPSRFDPNTDLRALGIEKMTDESSEAYEAVLF